MARFEFDLEDAVQELDDAENLLSVFWGFFNEERPFGKKIDATHATLFVEQCKLYDSVMRAAWGKVRSLRTEMESAIENHYHGDNQKGGEAA